MASACRIANRVEGPSADLTVFCEDTGDYHENCGFPGIYRHELSRNSRRTPKLSPLHESRQLETQHRHGRGLS
jgi:hypothetical protein